MAQTDILTVSSGDAETINVVVDQDEVLEKLQEILLMQQNTYSIIENQNLQEDQLTLLQDQFTFLQKNLSPRQDLNIPEEYQSVSSGDAILLQQILSELQTSNTLMKDQALLQKDMYTLQQEQYNQLRDGFGATVIFLGMIFGILFVKSIWLGRK